MLGFAHGRLIDCDKVEVGYVRLAEVGAEFLFQVVAERGEKAAVIVTSNLPFSEWTQVIRMPGCLRHCSTALPIGRTSSRPAQSPTASAGPSKSEKAELRTNTTSAPPPATSKKGNCNRLVLSSQSAKKCTQHVPCAISGY